MFWIKYLKVLFLVSEMNYRELNLSGINEDLEEFGDNSIYTDDDWERGDYKFKRARAKIVSIVNGRELRFLGALGKDFCRELLQERLTRANDSSDGAEAVSVLKDLVKLRKLEILAEIRVLDATNRELIHQQLEAYANGAEDVSGLKISQNLLRIIELQNELEKLEED